MRWLACGMTELFCCLIASCGQPLKVWAGIQGNENDRATWKLCPMYHYPEEYFLENNNIKHNGLFDGVYQGELHRKTERKGITPFTVAELRAATPARRREMVTFNRQHRRLRVVIEQLYGIIKQWKIVGNTIYRGEIKCQGYNFLLCTQLTAWLMAKRDSYPRGANWRNRELEQWEIEMGEYLEVDPLEEEMYSYNF